MKRLVCLLAVICAVFSSSAFAILQTPTITGSTGLIEMPTGDTLGPKDWNMAVDYVFNSTAAPISSLNGNWVYKMNMGSFMGYTKGMELGFVGMTDRTTNQFKEGVFINMKYSLASSDDPDALHMAIGLQNLTSLTQSNVYMVASKYFESGLGIHFGALFDFPNYNTFRTSGMFGTNIPVGAKELTLMGEVFAGDTIFQVDAGIRYELQKSCSLLFRGLNITNNANARDSQSYSAGISLTDLF